MTSQQGFGILFIDLPGQHGIRQPVIVDLGILGRPGRRRSLCFNPFADIGQSGLDQLLGVLRSLEVGSQKVFNFLFPDLSGQHGIRQPVIVDLGILRWRRLFLRSRGRCCIRSNFFMNVRRCSLSHFLCVL